MPPKNGITQMVVRNNSGFTQKLDEDAVLTNVPAAQRLIQKVLEGLNPEDGNRFVTAYIDDILAYSYPRRASRPLAEGHYTLMFRKPQA